MELNNGIGRNAEIENKIISELIEITNMGPGDSRQLSERLEQIKRWKAAATYNKLLGEEIKSFEEIYKFKEMIRHKIQYAIDEFVSKTGWPIDEIELGVYGAHTGDADYYKSNHVRSLVNFKIKL